MIAKEVAKRKGTSSFARLVTYLTDDMGNATRVARIRTTHLHNDGQDALSLQGALEEVANHQSLNSRAQEKTLHLVLSFHESLPVATLDAIEDQVIQGLGYEGHRRVSVLHQDTPHPHLHVAIDKVHRSEKTHAYICKHNDFGRLKLDRMAVELERRYGLRPDRHRWNEGEGIEAARQGMVTRLQSDWVQELQAAQGWSEAHVIAEKHGVKLQPVGANGLRVVQDDGVSAAASAVHEDCRRRALEQRFGPFVADDPRAEPPQPQRRPIRPPDDLTQRLKRTAANEFKAAATWEAFHAVAKRHGLRVLPRGGGLAFEDMATGELAKASAVSNHLSLGRCKKRLGPFEGAPEAQPASVRIREAVIQTAATEVARAHDERRRCIEVMPPAIREHWHALAVQDFQHEQDWLTELHRIERQLTQSYGLDWHTRLELGPTREAPRIELATPQQAILLQRLFNTDLSRSDLLIAQRLLAHAQPREQADAQDPRITRPIIRPTWEPHLGLVAERPAVRQRSSLFELPADPLVRASERPSLPVPHHERGVPQQQSTRPMDPLLRWDNSERCSNRALTDSAKRPPVPPRRRARGRRR